MITAFQLARIAASWFETRGVAALLTMRVRETLILRRREAPSRRMRPRCSKML
jgi:hypothetical protein